MKVQFCWVLIACTFSATFLNISGMPVVDGEKLVGIVTSRDFRNEQDLNETKERIFIKTRQYAKRQNTWARGQMMTWQKIDPKKLGLSLKKLK